MVQSAVQSAFLATATLRVSIHIIIAVYIIYISHNHQLLLLSRSDLDLWPCHRKLQTRSRSHVLLLYLISKCVHASGRNRVAWRTL